MSVSSRLIARILLPGLAALVLGSGLVSCAKTAPSPGGLGDPCIVNADCASGFICSGGACVLPANLGGCTAGDTRCNGDDVEACASDGQEWNLVTTCATGCISGGCAPQICTPNVLRCDGDASEECTPSGNAWAFLQECPSHCDSTSGKCKAPICTPFATTCSSDGLSVLTCDSFGAVETSTACPTGDVCQSGNCVAHVCTPGAKQCQNDAAEECAPDGSAWILVNICPSHCDAANGTCEAPICTPFAVICSADNTAVLTCDSFGATEVSSACGQGQICDSGRCQTVVCTPGAVRCASGSAGTEVCNTLGDGWLAGVACPFGCGTVGNANACLAAVCAVGASRCSPVSPSALEECVPQQTGWAFETFCTTGCTQTTASTASCNPLVCPPLARRCDPANNGMVDTCSQLGTEWDPTDTCPQGCAAGQCVTDSADCNPGDMRCNGLDTQGCTTVANDPGVTQWTTTGTCLAGCSSGACLPGGSCVTPSLFIGAPLSDAGVPTSPGDGQSSVLVYSAPIVGEDSATIPDGQLFTVTATLLPSLPDGGPIQLVLPTADADPSTPGTQVATSGGRIRFTVPAAQVADGGSGTVQVTAQLEQGGSCNAQSSFALTGDPIVVGSTILLAEDFSTTAFRDSANTTANWSTTAQALTSVWPDGIGNGGDGDLAVTAANTPYNLGASGFAPAFAVLGLSAQAVVVDGVAQGLSGGDEVLLWDAQGSSQGAGNAGTYELLTVQSTSGSNVVFSSPIQNNYGAAADQDVSTQRVSLQRVPHFGTLSVSGAATLTTNKWDGTKGGLIFLRANHIVLSPAATTAIDVSSLGFRGGVNSAGEDETGVAGFDAPGGGGGGVGTPGSGGSYATQGSGSALGAVYGSPLLGKLFLGAGGGATTSGNAGSPGGGAVVLFADSIDFTSAGKTAGLVNANGGAPNAAGAGAGGTIWIGAPTMTVGTAGLATVAEAQGGSGGNLVGAGRIRIDAQTVDMPGFGGAACTRTGPACTYGISGPVLGQSLPMISLSGAPAVIEASLLVALDASTDVTFAAAATESAQDFAGVAIGAPLNFSSGSPPHTGSLFRWNAMIAPDPTVGPSFVRGLQWQLTISPPGR